MANLSKGFSTLFLSTVFAFASAGSSVKANQEPSQQSEPQAEATIPPLRVALATKENCPVGEFEKKIDSNRVTLIIDVDPSVKHMVGYSAIWKDVSEEYAPKIKIPMDIILLVPKDSNDVHAPCWNAEFSQNHNIAIVFGRDILAMGKGADDTNPSVIDSVLTFSRAIEIAQNLGQRYLQSKQVRQPFKPSLSV